MGKAVLNLRLFFILIFLSLFLALLDSLDSLNTPKSWMQNLTAPVQYGLYKGGKNISKQIEFLFLIRKAAQENKALKFQLSQLLVENAALQKKLAENEILVDQYNKLNPQTFDLLPARVLGISRYLSLDKGSLDGVQRDQVVVFKDHYLGQIKEVSPKTSTVLLSTDPDSKIAAFSQGMAGRSKGILIGQFGSKLFLDKLLHEENIQAEDIVYSEGTEGKLPKGLILGKVVEVLPNQNEVFKQAKIVPLFSAANLDLVFIMKNL